MSGYRASVVLARFRVQRAAAPALMPSKLQSLASAPTAWIALAVALVMNAANLLEPVTVDDVCHHYYAAQVLREPLNPFGFEALWHQKPVPAWTIMVAPVHSFYWAPGLWLFGDWIPGWHLWMLPVQWLLCGSLLSLLRRWVGRGAVPLLCAIVLGPAILPGINLMLDVPMLSLSMAALALVMRASDRHSAALAIAAGVLWGLSFQTKYSAMCLFGPWFLLALLRPRGREFVIGFAAAVGTALSIEGLMALSHEGGGSYFIQQLSYTQDRVWSPLFKGMFQHVGVLAIPAVLRT
ncbi:MAG: glycosyltransferase family 39 protein, partial [Planctomycetota bacterium]